jgi:autotransporter-associated beta strand protein
VTGEPVQLRRSDGYPNLVLEFQTKNTGSYGAFNPMTRETSQPMMVNEIRLTGNFTSQTTWAGGPNGNPLLFVGSLAGASPKIRLDATSSETDARFQFQIHTQLQLFDNLEVVGDGTQDFIITGALRDFYDPRSITKSGTSILTLKGNNTFGGDLVINGGQVKLTGPVAAINGANAIKIGSAGAFSMDSGLVAVNRLELEPGGGLEFTGGELRTSEIVGSLTNQGGNFSPASAAVTTITGDYTQSAGMLTIELGGTIAGQEHGVLDIGGMATLGGTLDVGLMPGFVPSAGQSFEILTADGGIVGNFSSTILPSVANPLMWHLEYLPNSLQLSLLGEQAIPTSFEDRNRDGIIDAADYVLWRKFGGTQQGYDNWLTNFGRIIGAGSLSHATVPEPSNWMLLLPLVILARSRFKTGASAPRLIGLAVAR